jgi:hypothetical protein
MHSDIINIYRFQFSNDIIKLINDFAIIHQYDDRKKYKEFWEKWVELNSSDIDDEITRMNCLGYEGDVLDKMFKAGRYYFRKKKLNETKKISDDDDTKKERRNYIIMDHDILDAMDNHINISLSKSKKGFRPASGYIDFCITSVELLTIEIKRLCSECSIDSSKLSDKIKKTYKNRYYLITRKK